MWLCSTLTKGQTVQAYSLLLQGYDSRFGPECDCLQDAWPKVWSLHVLPKQQNT